MTNATQAKIDAITPATYVEGETLRAFDRLWEIDGQWPAAAIQRVVEGWSPEQVREAQRAVYHCIVRCEMRDDYGSLADYEFIEEALEDMERS